MRLALVVVAVVAMRGVAAAVLCSTIEARPGAIYLYGDAPTSSTFNGNSFFIDGNDHALTGGVGAAPAIVGIAAHTEDNAQEVRDSLGNVQKDNVIGLGFEFGPPLMSSIAAVQGSDSAAIDQLVASLLAGPHVESSVASITSAVLLDLGTHEMPHVTHLTGQGAGVVIKANANLSGAGILIVEDALTLEGTLSYDGLIIVRGPLAVAGSWIMFGSAWTTNVSLAVGGNCIVYYSSEGLGDALAAAGTCVTPVCGDGILTEGEQCDDGNTLDGDCCSSTCTAEPATSACTDDGNACTDDRCDGAGACIHPNTSSPCDDGDACTEHDTCTAAACIGTSVDCGACMQCDSAAGCIAAPALDCREPLVLSLSRLGLSDSEDDRRDRLSWRWRSADGLAWSDLGDPLATTGYSLCLFGGPDVGAVVLRAFVPPGTECGTSCGWTVTSRGFRYRDRLGRTGITRIDLAARLPGIGGIRVAGAGAALHMPELPFPISAPLVLQLRADGGKCWQTTFPMGNIGFSGRLTARGGQP